MVSGIVPSLIYYGLQVMQTDFFLVACCLLCSIVSVMTGSSWTTIATIGIALIGIGEAQGFSTGWVAGAIISGAYFGDKMSPLSDTTVLAASVTDTPLFTHIRYMLYTTVPSMIVTLIVFSIAGFSREAADASQIAAFSEALKGSFHITPWLMIVPIVTGIMKCKKIRVMLSSMPLADMAPPKHMAQMISQIVFIIPAIPRVETREFRASLPVCICVLS